MSVNIIACSSQLMHVEVKPTHGVAFSCTIVYGATSKHVRLELLQHLEALRSLCNGPWIILGDFNCIANLNERIGQAVRLSKILPLKTCMENCNMHDMKSSGRFYTWNNKQTNT